MSAHNKEKWKIAFQTIGLKFQNNVVVTVKNAPWNQEELRSKQVWQKWSNEMPPQVYQGAESFQAQY